MLSIYLCVCRVCVCDRVLSVISVRRGCVTEGGVSTPTRAPVRWDLRCVWSVRETCGAMVREEKTTSQIRRRH